MRTLVVRDEDFAVAIAVLLGAGLTFSAEAPPAAQPPEPECADDTALEATTPTGDDTPVLSAEEAARKHAAEFGGIGPWR